MTITNGYTTLAKLQDFLGRDSADVDGYGGTNDPRASFLEDCITGASRFIDNELGLPTGVILSSQTVTDTVDAYHPSQYGFMISKKLRELRSSLPIISVTSLSLSGTLLTVNSDYYVYSHTIEADGEFSSDRKAYSLAAVIGYATIPAQIDRVCCQIAAVMSGLSTSVFSDDSGDLNQVIQRNVPEWCYKALDKFRVLWI